ncbi:MAG: C4-dicarboxylate ABC transporter [Desulfitobacteriaceae bacterium]|nr:C4-dicarboxylate ABC transporter [Desulfitobacteriaceae bacterium]MDI6913167.1 C4-dicarboxylate ABC transporter [Desulfitobacteriaceae bacterium]
MAKNNLIRHFSPAWFAAIMGTGGFANVLYLWGGAWSVSRILGMAIAWLNALLFVLFLIPWLGRWFAHYDQLKLDLKHPIMSNFFVTMPVGTMILASNAALMGTSFLGRPFVYGFAWIAWLIGITGALILGVYVSYNSLASEQTPPQVLNFAWLISPVASIAVPLIGNPLVSMVKDGSANTAKTILLLNLSFYGIGFFLFIFIGALVLGRLIQHPLPTNAMTPTFWITLGPIGVGAVSLMGLADSAKSLGLLASVDTAYLLAAIFWGLGLWAVGVALSISWRYLKNGGVPFSLSWWAFIFPLAAYTMASLKLASYFSSALILWYTVLLTLLLAVLWALTLIRTLGGVANGKLFQPQPQPQPGNGSRA